MIRSLMKIVVVAVVAYAIALMAAEYVPITTAWIAIMAVWVAFKFVQAVWLQTKIIDLRYQNHWAAEDIIEMEQKKVPGRRSEQEYLTKKIRSRLKEMEELEARKW